jgi:hypothetical protein
VQPLSRDDSLNVVRSVLNVERIIELATEEIVAKADGNPLFLEQLSLHAGEARDLRSVLMVPDTIHDVVMARIASTRPATLAVVPVGITGPVSCTV